MGYLDSEGLQQQIQYIKGYLRQHGGIPVGHEYFSVNPNIPQGSLPLFGGEYSRETYSALWTWVQAQSGYLISEADWQTASTANNGNVPFYSSGDGSTTFRVPSLKCWIKGANGTVTEVGSYLEAGLPNITGYLGIRNSSYNNGVLVQRRSGAFYSGGTVVVSTTDSWSQSDTDANLTQENFDASRSNSIYGNSATVQPESIVGMWLVKAYGTIEDTGTIDEQQYIDDRIATRLPLTGGTMTGAIEFGTFAGKILDFGGTGHGNLSLQEENDHQVIYFSANTNGGYPPEGAQLILHSVDSNGGWGSATIRVGNDGSTCKNLNINPSGSLTWDGKDIERVNSKSLTHNGGYVRYENGLQICWSTITVNTQYSAGGYATRTWTYPVAFTVEPIVWCNSRHDRFNVGTNSNPIGTASCTIYSVNTHTSTAFTLSFIDCVAIGTWK